MSYSDLYCDCNILGICLVELEHGFTLSRDILSRDILDSQTEKKYAVEAKGN